MIKSIFFDWDGTLVDSIPFLFKAHNVIRERLGHPVWTFEEYSRAIVYSTRELYPTIYGDRAPAAIEMLYAYIEEHHLESIRVIDGAKEILDNLAIKDVPMGLVSNKRHDVLVREVEHLGWQKYFGIYNGAGVSAKDKPSGLPLIHAVENHPKRPPLNGVLYVGDTESDLNCAAEAGCPAAFIHHVPESDWLIETYKPRYVVKTLPELQQRLMEYLAEPL